MLPGKAFTAIKLGPSCNKPFKDKLNDLDDTLEALEVHVGPLRDSFTAKTSKGVQHLEKQIESLEQFQQASKTAIDRMMEVLVDTNRTAKCKLTAVDDQDLFVDTVRDAREGHTNPTTQASS